MPYIPVNKGSKTNWLDYWRNYLRTKHGKSEVSTEEDLYLQVARTVNRKPIDRIAFEKIVDNIKTVLDLQPNDVLIDLCCGNGLFTYELKDKVSRIIAVDFADEIIDTARRLKPAYNIDYCLRDVLDFLAEFQTRFPGIVPCKYLMNDSIAYFSVEDIKDILTLMKQISYNGFTASFRGAPNDELKWNYYTTDDWKNKYLKSVESGDQTHDGLGRWWQMVEIDLICSALGLEYTLTNQPEYISNYRTDIVIRYNP
jgi:SAM-dependent methyltransferase